MGKFRNLLLIWTDEQRADTLAAYGNNVVRAPNLDALARESWVFENAYCTQPVCTPSRASILTGLWPHTHGCVANNTPLPVHTPTLAEMLPEEYECAYFGKWHLGDEIIAQRGFSSWLSIEDGMYRPYYSRPEYLERRSDYHHFLVSNGFPPDSFAKDGGAVFSRNYSAVMAEPYTKAGFLGESAASYLRGRKDERPFFLSVNFLEPHMPFFGPLNGLYDPHGLPEGEAFASAPGKGTSLRNRLLASSCTRKGQDGMQLKTPEDWRRVKANYYGLVTQVDNAVGWILQALADSGMADETLVVFTSDHGDQMGDHGLIGKTVMYEESIRIPLTIRAPWLGEGGRVPGRVSQIGLVPTVLEMLKVETPDHLQGQSLAPLLGGGPPEGDIVVEWNPDPALAGEYAPVGYSEEDCQRVARQSWRTLISQEGWKLSVSDEDETGELYELKLDPAEMVNRWGEATIRGDLLDRLRGWQKINGDTLGLDGI